MKRLEAWLAPALLVLWSAFMVASGFGFANRGRDADRQELTRLRLKTEQLRTQAIAWRGLYLLKQAKIDTVYVTLKAQTTATQDTTDKRLEAVAAASPEACAPIVATCRERLEAERANTAHWQKLFQDQRDAAGTADSSAVKGIQATDTAKKGIEVVLGPEKRSFFKILLRPKLEPGLGAFAGYCANGKPCVGAGGVLMLKWEF